MKLKVIGSSSAGNCYLLQGRDETLILECGMGIRYIKRALGFNFTNVVGCVVTHRHLDHCVAMKDLLASGVEVWANKETHGAMGTENHHRAGIFRPFDNLQLGEFKIMPFDVKHDVPTVGFLIHHRECGNLLFLTDTYYCEYTFEGLTNILVEANFAKDIVDRRVKEGGSPQFLRNRVLKSHLSLEHCKELLAANDLSKVNNIVLIHLSDGNSDAERFKREVADQTGKTVEVAVPGLEMIIDKTPF